MFYLKMPSNFVVSEYYASQMSDLLYTLDDMFFEVRFNFVASDFYASQMSDLLHTLG